MSYDKFKDEILKHLEDYKKNTLKITKKGIYRGNQYKHILPEEDIAMTFLDLAKVDLDNNGNLHSSYPLSKESIKLHQYSHHLNSSQAMCINFFSPLIRENNHNILLKLLQTQNIPVSSKIEEASFEKVFDTGIHTKEKTNFDFFLKLQNDIRIFFEIKYTEYGFGGLSSSTKPKSYVDKWNNTYKPYMSNTLYCKQFKDVVATEDNYKEIEFYKHYQIYRNISYIQNQQDFVVFLTMKNNPKTKADLQNVVTAKNLGGDNVKIIFWEDLIKDTLKLVNENTKLRNHFDEFKRKYFLKEYIED